MAKNEVNFEKFQKEVKSVFDETTVIPSFSTVIPEIKTMKMKTSIDEKCVIKWNLSIESIDLKKGKKQEKVKEIGKKSGEKTGEYIEIGKILSEKKERQIKCDGPCGQFVKSSDVTQFGCDHMICKKCRISQKSTALFDGSPGCCHVDCIKKAIRDGMRFQSGRQLNSINSSISLLSNPGPWEILFVNICVIKKWSKHVYRTLLEYEFPSQTRVAELMNTLQPYRETIASGRSYYSWKKPKDYEDLEQISLIDTNLRFYNLMGYKPLSNGKIFIICVSDEILLE